VKYTNVNQFGNIFDHLVEFTFIVIIKVLYWVKLRSKIVKSPKIDGKVCAHHFVEIAERFKENSMAVV